MPRSRKLDPQVSGIPSEPSDAADGDAALVQAFVSGRDRERACARLLERYWKPVVGWIALRTRNLRDAEELAQDAFARAFRSLSSLESPQRFPAWLFRIAGNLTTDWLRRRKAMVSLDQLAEDGFMICGAAASADVELAERESSSAVLEAITRLPEKYRLVITLRYLCDMSAKDIAEQLAEPEGTIRNRVFRAIAKLRELLDDHA
jgi:RNA polymerase sigma-70 factor (ECF subfamily)